MKCRQIPGSRGGQEAKSPALPLVESDTLALQAEESFLEETTSSGSLNAAYLYVQ